MVDVLLFQGITEGQARLIDFEGSQLLLTALMLLLPAANFCHFKLSGKLD